MAAIAPLSQPLKIVLTLSDGPAACLGARLSTARMDAVKRPACGVGYRWRGALGRFTLSFGEGGSLAAKLRLDITDASVTARQLENPAEPSPIQRDLASIKFSTS